MQLRFALANRSCMPSLNPTRKSVCQGIIKSHAEVLPKIWVFPFNIYTIAEARDFKFGTPLGFAKAQHKTTPGGKVGVALG